MRESALSFVIEHTGLDAVPYCRTNLRERGLVPHLTVLYPWFPAPLASSAIERAAQAVAGTGPLRLCFDALDTFPAGVVYASLTDPGQVLTVMERVWAEFPETPPYRGEIDRPLPHLTLGRSCPPSLSAALDEVRGETAHLLPFEVTVDQLGVLEEDERGRWAVIGHLDLR